MAKTAENYRSREYWIVENAQYARPSFRLEKCARIVSGLAGGRACNLLDVGCGPAALRQVLPSNIDYYGMDIAIHQPASYLKEVDFGREPISFNNMQFDFVVGMGILEYMGEHEQQKFEEIRKILKPDGKFILSYINFDHFRKRVWPNYNNVQPIEKLVLSLKKVFNVDKYFPASHHWRQKQPGKYAVRPLQMHLNFKIPIISPALAVEYFFVCSQKT